MASIYDITGMGNTPMFINYKPFRLDFSRAFAADERAFMMAGKLQERFDQVRDQAHALQIPEIDGLDIDRTEQYEEANKAYNDYQRAIDVANPIAGQRSPEARAAMSRYMQAISPTRLSELKGKQAEHNIEGKNIQVKPELGSQPTIGPDGMFISDGEGGWETRTKTQHLRQFDPERSINTAFGKNYNPSENINQTAEETYARWNKMIMTNAQTSSQQAMEGGRNGITGRPTPPEAQKSLDDLLYSIRTKSAYSGNQKQLESGLNTMMIGVTDAELYSLIPAYQQTQQYHVLKNAGRFYNKETGKEDPRLVYDAMRNERTLTLPIPGAMDKNFKVKHAHGSFVERELINQMGRFVNTSSANEVSWDQLDPKKAAGASGGTKNPAPITQQKSLQYSLDDTTSGLITGPDGIVRPAQGSNATGKVKVNLPLVVASSDTKGGAAGKMWTVEGYSEKMEPDTEKDWRQMLGLDGGNFVNADIGDGDLGQWTWGGLAGKTSADVQKLPTLASRGLHNNVYLAGNLVSNEKLANARIVGTDATYIMVPGALFRPEASNYQNLVQRSDGSSMMESTTGFSSQKIEMPDGSVRYEPYLNANRFASASGNQYTTPMVKVTLLVGGDDLKRIDVNTPSEIDLSTSATAGVEPNAFKYGFQSRADRLDQERNTKALAKDMAHQLGYYTPSSAYDDKAISYLEERGVVRKVNHNNFTQNSYLVDVYMPLSDAQGNIGSWKDHNQRQGVGVYNSGNSLMMPLVE